jgi:MYXO-CTERM domain-containing protein
VYAGWIGFQNGAYGAYMDHSPPADRTGALHFTAPVKISSTKVGTAFYVRLVAGDRGRIDAIYLGTDVHDVPVTPANVQANNGGAGKLDCQPALRDPGLKGVRALGKPCEMPASTRWRLHLVQSLDAGATAPRLTDQLLRPGSVHPGDLCTLGINCLPDDNRDITDVNDIRIDATGGFQVAYTAENDARTHNEVDFQCQTGGPGLYAGVTVRSCRAAARAATPIRPVAAPPPLARTSLAATGTSAVVPAFGLLVLAAAALLRRRQSLRPQG